MNWNKFLPCILLTTVLGACSGKGEQTNVEPTALCLTDSLLRIVSVDTVHVQEVIDELTLNGRVTFNENQVAHVYPMFGGTVTELKAEIGDFVRKGDALAVDREKFAEKITKLINENPLIEVVNEEITDISEMSKDGIVIIATGPLTSKGMTEEIAKITGQDKLYFYDAAAPIITKESIDFNIAFWGDRYEQEKKKEETIEQWKDRINAQKASYINLPMNQEEYERFCNELINAEVVMLHEFEKREIFEGCMPVEVMAKRGLDTLRFGPLKPVGFDDPRTGKRPYAVVQLRQDDVEGKIFNMVGFQTNLKFGEQKRVFSLIPGLENAEFVKYGVMHRNTYINSTKLLDETYNLKLNNNIFFAGQITGVEGYVESISSGLVAAINACQKYTGNTKVTFPETTIIGALAKYISTENEKFQPMNANFGIIPALNEKIKDKKIKYGKLADRALEDLKKQ